jgi:serine/threonine-protein kinase
VLAPALADRYRIERELGQGGMATVYLAEDLKHHRKVAIKVLRPELAAVLGSDRFLREIETTASLRHPHILPLFDSGAAPKGTSSRQDDDQGRSVTGQQGSGEIALLYYVMPYVEGESLRDRLDREKQLPLDDTLEIAREVADALSYAHTRGVIHRDIKPENILLESGHAVVADFGIARAITSAGGERLTQTGMAIGTPQYMSPEQAAGEKDLDGRSDLYALGCVLYEMLAGQPPFTGPTVESVVHQHLTVEPPSITRLRPAVPTEIAGALQRALAKTPADRFNPVAQFSDALRRLAVPAPVAAPRPAWRTAIVTSAVIGVGILVALFALRGGSPSPLPVVGRTTQVTREPGLEVDAAISPDGQLVAYASGPTTGMQIFMRQVAGGRTVQLTSDSGGNARWPRWSPDGRRIAYQTNDGIYTVPALGGPPRLVVRSPEGAYTFGASFTSLTGLAWSPDGTRLAYAGGYGSSRLFVVNADGGEPVALATISEVNSPAWSPDGRHIAVVSGNPIFIFGSAYFGNSGTSSLWLVAVDSGTPRRLTQGTYLDTSPQWTPDSRAILFASNRGGSRDLFRLRVAPDGTPEAEPERMTTGLDAQTFTLTPDGRHLAYARLRSTSNIWAVPAPRPGAATTSDATALTTGDQIIERLDVSRDGRWLVFDSDRGGSIDLYKMPTAGGEATQLTTDSAAEFSPSWSPDGKRIAFHRIRNGNRDVYTMESDGTGQTQRTSGAEQELDAEWSPSGDSLVVEMIETESTGNSLLAIVPLNGGIMKILPSDVQGDFPVWSPSGDVIAYHTIDGIRLITPTGGDTRLLVDNTRDKSEAFYADWSSDGSTLYYLARADSGWMIRSVSSQGGTSRILVRLDDPTHQPTRYGFRSDGRAFYVTLGSQQSDVWVLTLEDR